MKRSLVFVISAIAIFGSSLAFGQGRPAGGKMDPAAMDARIEKQIEATDKAADLKMTGDQKKKAVSAMKEIGMKMTKEFQSMNKPGQKPDMAALQAKMKPMMEKMMAEAKAAYKRILKPDQFKKFEAYEAKMKASMGGRMGGGMPGKGGKG